MSGAGCTRVQGGVHAAALRAFLALVPAYGHSTAGRITRALHDDALDDALTVIDRGHGQLLRDRETLDAVRDAVDHLMAESDAAGTPGRPVNLRSRSTGPDTLTVGELARRLGVTPATLRKWEDSGILAPGRDPLTAYRVYRASDIRDAELAHLLRRGGHHLDHISTVVQRIRTAGGTDTLSGALDDWRRRPTARGLAMLDAATHLSHYLGHWLGHYPSH